MRGCRPPVARPGRLRWIVGALLALLILDLILALPALPVLLAPAALLRVPLELPAIVLLLVAVPRFVVLPLRAVLTGALTVIGVLKLADIGAEIAYLRPFNPVLDQELVPAAWRLARGTFGLPGTLAAALGLVAAVAVVAGLVWWATGCIAHLAPRSRGRVAGLAVAAVALVALDLTPAATRFDPPGSASTTRLAWEHLRDGWNARGDLARFRADAVADPYAALPPEAILPDLRGTDVFVIFIESYGRSALENPLYAPTVTAALHDDEALLAKAGLVARSGWLTAPMVGGQSWLAHASILSGLWIDNQGRYRALLDSPRRTLMHLAHKAGWETAAVEPAITLAWPEADYFGYDRVFAAADLGYRGLPFNWVTMPDQYTLSAVEQRLLTPGPRKPVFVEMALISSHAPWTPIPPILPWDAVGDGRAFDRFATAGDPPDLVWQDQDRIRNQYRLSLDYTLRVLGEFAARHADRPPLIVMLGDHQPAAFVSQDTVRRDVPVHVIGAPADLARLDGWGWTPGLVPAADAPVWGMDAFRDRFLTAFGTEAAAPGLHAASR